MSLLCSLVALLLIVTVSASDEAALLAFKAQLSHSGSLASWNSSTGFCSWEGVTCSQHTPARVVELRLNGTRIAGALSPAIGNLTFLRTLDLGINSLQGGIPASLGRLRRLQRLYLDDNSFSGTLPANLSSCVSITEMRLDNNTLGGRIPAELGQKLTHLALITLRNDIFTGTIPASLANLSHLQFVDLSINQLVGSIPPGLGSIQSMRYFTLARNLINGMIPPSLYNWSSLGLDGNHFTGTIPSSVSNISSLIEVGFDSNRFGGYVPPTLGKLGALQYLNFHYNKLEANDTKGWEFITSLANCSRLEILELSTNLFAGKLPGSIVNLSTTLHALGLSENMISGVIPSALGNLSQLNRLYAYHCNLEGPIPASLGELRNLFALDLSMNHHLNSSISKEIFKLPSLSYFLDLSYNSFSGPLPSEVGSLKSLNALILSGNQLSGKIPDSLQNCIVLVWLLLDNNSFEGSIPQSLKNMKGLSKLNMTLNKFSGNIPIALGSIGNLQELYLAVAGNVNLCGSAPQLHLAPCSTSHLSKKKKKMSKPLVISLTTAGAILFSLSVILVVWILCKKLKPNQKTLTQNSIADNHYKRIPYDALLRGTNEFSEVNLLGRGSYGAVYKCVLDTEDRTLAVKVFNLGQSRYSKSFEVECEAMRRIRLRCLIKIITSCSSVNHQGQEFKALVFEFMPNGNLDGWLHPKSQEPSTNNTLSLAQRLDTAVDIVDAVEYLHNYCQPLVIHCDLKPSNILLAEDMSARVGDFGISRILQENTSEGMRTSYSSTGIRGSIGYVAPEYGEGSAVSTAGDIYSLGILLLEMFTGRNPTEGMFRDSLDLHKFAEDALPDRTLEIAQVHRGA